MVKKPPVFQGAPEWVLTYGDLMSLLLCFFILLAAFANFETPNPKLEEVLQSIQSVFGIKGQAGVMSTPGFEFSVLIKELEKAVRRFQVETRSRTNVEGVEGRYASVRKIRDGAEITLGGPITFQRFSADLTPDASRLLRDLAGLLTGRLNRIEVRGHASAEPLPADSPYRDPMDLSVARAQVVARRLIEAGVNPRTVRIVGSGCNEPLVPRATRPEDLAANRRVEIVVRESVVADYDSPAAPAPTTRQAAPAEEVAVD